MIGRRVSAELVGPDWFRLTEPVVYYETAEPVKTITAEAGFYTDFLSIPALARPFFSRTGKSAAAGVIHDALYSGKAKLSWLHPVGGLTRKQSDKVLYRASRDLGESRTRAMALYLGVRAFGGKRWRQYRSKRRG